MNIQTLTTELNALVEAAKTTRKTWNWVNKFWNTQIDLGANAQQILDRVAVLEYRMAQQHGWKR